jgi:hypothetical protein
MTNFLAIVSALLVVESSNGKQLNPKQDAVGYLGIKKVTVDDCNRILKHKHFKYSDRQNLEQSILMCHVILSHYLPLDYTLKDVALLWKAGAKGRYRREVRPEDKRYVEKFIKAYKGVEYI